MHSTIQPQSLKTNMTKKLTPELTQELVRLLFDYKNGELFWKHKIISRGRKLKKGGQKVSTLAPDGYLKVGFNSKQYLVHRIFYMISPQ